MLKYIFLFVISMNSMSMDHRYIWEHKREQEQSNRGACHAFAVTSLIEAILYKYTGNNLDLSEGDLFYQHFVRGKEFDIFTKLKDSGHSAYRKRSLGRKGGRKITPTKKDYEDKFTSMSLEERAKKLLYDQMYMGAASANMGVSINGEGGDQLFNFYLAKKFGICLEEHFSYHHFLHGGKLYDIVETLQSYGKEAYEFQKKNKKSFLPIRFINEILLVNEMDNVSSELASNPNFQDFVNLNVSRCTKSRNYTKSFLSNFEYKRFKQDDYNPKEWQKLILKKLSCTPIGISVENYEEILKGLKFEEDPNSLHAVVLAGANTSKNIAYVNNYWGRKFEQLDLDLLVENTKSFDVLIDRNGDWGCGIKNFRYLPGDLNNDGKINQIDIVHFEFELRRTKNYARFDLNNDLIIDFRDYTKLKKIVDDSEKPGFFQSIYEYLVGAPKRETIPTSRIWHPFDPQTFKKKSFTILY